MVNKTSKLYNRMPFLHIFTNKYVYAGKRAKAYELYELAATYAPDNIYVQLSQLFLDTKSNDITAAGNHITSLLTVQADNTKLTEELYNAAVNLGYTNSHETAIACYQQVIKSFPDAGQTHYALQRMAIEYSKLEDEDNARKSFDLEALDRTIDMLVIDYNYFPKKADIFRKHGYFVNFCFFRLDFELLVQFCIIVIYV